MTIEGTGFAEGASVEFGGEPAANAAVTSASAITAVVPAGTGPNDVTVTNAVGSSPTEPEKGKFTYTSVKAPTVTRVNPPYGAEAGGQVVTVVGSEFIRQTASSSGARRRRASPSTPARSSRRPPRLARGSWK